MVLLIDNFDSFSHILADYLRQLGVELHIVRNDIDPSDLLQSDWEALILSPGPESPQKAGNLMRILEQFVFRIPILGICLGHQAIGEFFGGKLVKGKQPVHGKVHRVYRQTQHPFLNNLPDSFEVTRYHSLEIQDVPEELEILLKTKDGEIMAMAHKNFPVFGIQYHPEAYLTQYGLEILKNWLTYCKSVVQHTLEDSK
ncbi:aminodeoxychorismate/anthranilate synthase component II [Cyclobacteriaceae bacterium YHN15]|jgi:anthranilate synthase component II|nr:aminodeoxychorismate/anthranilate synthase component II [Cyclobacteriaceae bacterium YHN15]